MAPHLRNGPHLSAPGSCELASLLIASKCAEDPFSITSIAQLGNHKWPVVTIDDFELLGNRAQEHRGRSSLLDL